MRFLMFRLSLVSLLILAPIAAMSTAMMEPYRKTLTVSYENGDLLEISCTEYSTRCGLRLLVNGEEFMFDSEVLGARITPRVGVLFSGLFSGRNEYFSFNVSVECPDAEETEIYRCVASALVEKGEMGPVSFYVEGEQ